MSEYLGDYPEDATVLVPFTTHEPDTGSPVAPSSAFEAADVAIYKDGGATQKTTANGLTMTSPFDSVTGLHLLAIDTSVDTGDSGFWATGGEYTVLLSPDETIDGNAALKVLGTFSIERTNGPIALARDILAYLSGQGSTDTTLVIKDDNSNIVADVDVTIRATNDATADPVASGKTDAFGVCQPHPLLDAGTYFVWRQKTGMNFENPQTIIVS